MNKGITGIKDQDREILLNIEDDKELLKACSLNKYLYKEVCNDIFFRNRLAKTYPDTLKYKPENQSWKQFYLSVIYYISKMKEDYDFTYKTGDPKAYWDILSFDGYIFEMFNLIGKNNAKDLYERKIKEFNSSTYKVYTVRGAAENNHKEFIDYLISKGNINIEIMNFGLQGASKGNNMDLINFFIDKGANEFNDVLYIASRNGNIKLMEFFINKGANKLNQAIAQAARENQKVAIEYLIEKGADNWLLGIIGAAGGGNLELLKYLIIKGQGTPITRQNLDTVIQSARDGKNGITKTEKGEKKYDEVIKLIEGIEKNLFG